MENILPILIADAPEALIELCGVNLLERLLRILQRLGFRSAIVFSTTPEIIGAELAKRSWARQQIIVRSCLARKLDLLPPNCVLEQSPSERFLIVPANIYCDARLLAALCAKQSPAALVDSDPPEFAQSLIRNPCGPALVTRDFLFALSPAPFFEELKKKIDNREIDIVDAAEEDDYIVSMRRRVRPVCFPAPPEQNRRLAERIILDSAQNGTLDLPAYIHATNRNGNHLASLQNANHAKPNYDWRFHHRMQRDRGIRAWPRRARNPRCSHIWYRRWTGRKAVARQNRNDRARQMGTSSRLF